MQGSGAEPVRRETMPRRLLLSNISNPPKKSLRGTARMKEKAVIDGYCTYMTICHI